MNNIPLLVEMLRESMAQGQNPALIVTSNSMHPLLQTDDFVILEPANTSQLQPGDIITIHYDNDLITHRFWGLKDGKLMTRGDRPLIFDPPWHPTQLVGRVVTRQRKDHELRLTTKKGQEINQALYELAQKEVRWLTRQSPSRYPSLSIAQQHQLLTRIVRRLFRWQAEWIIR